MKVTHKKATARLSSGKKQAELKENVQIIVISRLINKHFTLCYGQLSDLILADYQNNKSIITNVILTCHSTSFYLSLLTYLPTWS